MNIQSCIPKQTPLPPQWSVLLAKTGLTPETTPEYTVLVWDGSDLIATGSRDGSLLKYLAVDPARQGEDLTATVLTHLRQEAFAAGCRHLFLYTKPRNRFLLQGLFFYPVAQTKDVLLMEDRKDGLKQYLESLPRFPEADTIGAAVMNCDPFTNGHRYLIETAAKDCDRLYVFVLSEDRGHFPAKDRLALVQAGTADLPNVTVVETGPYLISAATFPTYFLPNRDQVGVAQCQLDIEIFGRYLAPALGITLRYVGTEPLSDLTNDYNRTLEASLPSHGITLHQISRLEQNGAAVSASRVRALLAEGNLEALQALVPPTTYRYLSHLQQEVNHHV